MNITDEQVKKILELGGIEYQSSPIGINLLDISRALIEIEQKLNFFNTNINFNFNINNKNVLIVDDLELSIYQLSNLLRKIGLIPSVARNKVEASAELRKKSFKYLLVDLFLPEYEDGLELIRDAVKLRSENNLDFHIMVISGTDDKTVVDNCFSLGIDSYIAKSEMWHNDILKYIHSTTKDVENTDYSKHIINSGTASYVMKRFNNKTIYENLITDINSEVMSDKKNILLNLENIFIFDSDNSYVFAEIYKIVAEHRGNFLIVNPTDKIKDALSFAYLEGVIPVFNSVETAIDYINKKALI